MYYNILNNIIMNDIEFEQVNFSNITTQDEYKIYFYAKKNNKKINIETQYIYQKISGFNYKNSSIGIENVWDVNPNFKKKNPTDIFTSNSNPYDKNNDVYIIIDNEQEACDELKKKLTIYDDKLNMAKDYIFGKFERLYEIQNSFYISKILSQEYCIFSLDIGWNYYLKETGELLSLDNYQIIKNTTIKFYSENKNKSKDEKKTLLNSLSVELQFIEDNQTVTKTVSMSDISNRKDCVNTEIYTRNYKGNTNKKIKKPNECDENELIELYGKPKKITIRTISELMEIYKNNSYVKFHCDIINCYINKNRVEQEKKRRYGFVYLIKTMEIINNIVNTTSDDNYNKPNDQNNDAKPMYLFGNKKNI